MEHLPFGDRMKAMSDALARKLSGYFPVNPATTAVLDSLCDRVVEFAPGAVIVGQDAPHEAIYLIDNGWALRARNMENGARQIVNVALPGDFVGLNALLFAESDFDHVARTHVTAFRIEPERARKAFDSIPNLSAALFWANAHEESILAERIVSLGRRSARARAAHVLCEFVARLEILEEARFPELAAPISQEDFADILG
ncbi:MAG: Crp/Fnr family transcriptional regulator, partial [Rubrimonas sp.]